MIRIMRTTRNSYNKGGNTLKHLLQYTKLNRLPEGGVGEFHNTNGKRNGVDDSSLASARIKKKHPKKKGSIVDNKGQSLLMGKKTREKPIQER